MKSRYGYDGGCNSSLTLRVGQGSWYGVLRMFSQLTDKGIDLQSFCPTKVGDGGFTD